MTWPRHVTSGLVLLSLVGCGLQKGDWGFGAIDQMVTPADPPGDGCGVVLPPEGMTEARSSCNFGPGAHPHQTLGISSDALSQIPIRHILIVMKENRSFDHLIGRLHERGQAQTEPIPDTYINLDLDGVAVSPERATTTCVGLDPGHQSESMIAALNGGKMDGFVTNAARTTASDGHFALSYYDEEDLPFYYWLGKTFALADRHFASIRSGTTANRNFLLFATHAGVIDTGVTRASPTTPSIMQTLMNAGFTWAVYADGNPFSSSLGWGASDPGVHPLSDLSRAFAEGTLPNVAFIDGIENEDDDHPTADIQRGEAWLKSIYDEAVQSPQWQRTALIWAYDEGGAFFDHVPPEPDGCPAEPGSFFLERGARVPMVVASPWAKRHFVSHVARDHTSITRFIETVFDLPALTARDANADALLDMFDFSCGVDRSIAPAPDTGIGGCTDVR